MWKKRTVMACAAAAVAAMALVGCSSTKTTSTPPAGGGTSAATVTGSITVLAASSLTDTFNKLGGEFEAAHPGVKVTFSYGASSTLAQQIVQGAPADVFAAASDATMKTVTDASDATNPQIFVKNQLVIAVPPGNPKNITGLADLTKPGLKVVECAKGVPCGDAAVKALAAANVTLTPVSFAQDVKSALSTVELGEADAALVYRTDALASGGKVTGIEFPESAKAITDYPIAALAHAQNPSTAAAFVAFIESPSSIAELTAAGFQKP